MVLYAPAVPSRFNRAGLAADIPPASPALEGVTWTYSDAGSATYTGRVDRCNGAAWAMIVPPSGTYGASSSLPYLVSGIDTTGATDQTARVNAEMAAAVAQGKECLFGAAGTIRCDSALTVPSGAKINLANSRLRYTGSATFIPFTSHLGTKVRNGRVSVVDPSATAFNFDGSFTCTLSGLTVDGLHSGATGATYRTQTGVRFVNNAGDNRVIDCDIDNLGTGVETQSIMNYLDDVNIKVCYRGIRGGDPTGAAFAAGISATNLTISGTSALGSGAKAIAVEGTAQGWKFENLWIEGQDVGVDVGTGTYGPNGFAIINGFVSATTTCINIAAARQSTLGNIRFGQDPAATPTELVVNHTNAPDGFAFNLISQAGFELPANTLGGNWIYMGRNQVELSNVTSSVDVLRARTSGDANPRMVIRASGNILFGSGIGAVDLSLSRAAATLLGINGGLHLGKITAPAAPAANNARCYVEDNGSGKLRLVFLPPSGVPIVLATEA